MGNRSKLDILHQEADFLVIDKPAGLLSVPDRFDADLPNAKHLLRQKFGNVLTVHRLDRDTSGLLCFALTPEAHRNLSTQFAEHRPQKTYLALVDGAMASSSGQIETRLTEDPRRPGRMITTDKNGLEAYTEFQVLERFADYTFVEVRIRTGRTHQIRVHFQSIGHPLVADSLYGRSGSFRLSAIKGRKYNLGKNKEERPLLARTALHAASLGFDHPVTGEALEFKAEMPKDIRATLQQLGKWNAIS